MCVCVCGASVSVRFGLDWIGLVWGALPLPLPLPQTMGGTRRAVRLERVEVESSRVDIVEWTWFDVVEA